MVRGGGVATRLIEVGKTPVLACHISVLTIIVHTEDIQEHIRVNQGMMMQLWRLFRTLTLLS